MTKILAAEIEIEVPFQDIDVMEVVWFGNYARYFEVARSALFRSLDFDYPQMRTSGFLWPVVEYHVKYVRPARYGQRITVRAELLEFENRLKIGYLIQDSPTGEKLTKGHTIQVAVSAETGEIQYVSPPVLLERVARVLS